MPLYLDALVFGCPCIGMPLYWDALVLGCPRIWMPLYCKEQCWFGARKYTHLEVAFRIAIHVAPRRCEPPQIVIRCQRSDVLRARNVDDQGTLAGLKTSEDASA
jgi:hypothetical protein